MLVVNYQFSPRVSIIRGWAYNGSDTSCPHFRSPPPETVVKDVSNHSARCDIKGPEFRKIDRWADNASTPRFAKS